MVLDDTPELLRWVGFNFADDCQEGKLRVWSLAPGSYTVRVGPDANGDDRIDRVEVERTIGLKRYETIPVVLPSRELYVVEAECVGKDVPLYERPDLAVTHEDATRRNDELAVVIHNIGCQRSGPFEVTVADASGNVLASKRHPGLEGVADLEDKKAALGFGALPDGGTLIVTVRGPEKEITEVNNVARVNALGERR
jgi:hypothetical protein